MLPRSVVRAARRARHRRRDPLPDRTASWRWPSTTTSCRCALARACNRYGAECYGEYADRLLPVAVVPNYTPDEALVELDYAVSVLGLRPVLFGGLVLRPAPGHDGDRAARWVDGLGLDSRVRLRPGLGSVRRARRLPHVPLDGHRVREPHVTDELRRQPHRQLRRRERGGVPIASLRRRDATLPGAALRLPRRRRRLGVQRVRGLSCRTGRSATATPSHTTTRRPRSGRARRPPAPLRVRCCHRTARPARRPRCGSCPTPTRTHRYSTSSGRPASDHSMTCATCSPSSASSAAKPTTR